MKNIPASTRTSFKTLAALMTLGLAFGGSAMAANAYWDSNGTTAGAGATPTGTWGTSTFWNATLDGTTAPAAWTSGNVAIFSAGTDAVNSYTVTLSGSQTIGGLTLEEGTPTISGGTSLVLNNAATPFNIVVGTMTISSVITGTAFGISKSGAGTLVLSGANTYTGATAITAGTLKLGAAGSGANTPLGTVAGITSVTAGAVLDVNGFTISAAEPLTLNGTGISSGGALTNSSTTAATFSGAVTLGSASSISSVASSTLTLSAGVSGAFNLTKVGAGTVALNGVIGTAAGTLNVTAGTLTVGNAANTFTGNVTINGATAILEMTSGSNGTATAAPLGIVTGGTAYKTVTISNGGTFRPLATYNDNIPSATLTGNGYVFSIGTGGGKFDVPTGVTLSIDDGSGPGTATTNAQLQGTGTLTKTGVGTLSLGNNTSNFVDFTGAIVINAGTLQFSATNSLSPLGATSAGTTISSGAVMNLNGTTMPFAEPLTISGTGLASAPAGVLTSTSATAASFAGPITLAADSTISIANTASLTLSNTINLATFNLTLNNTSSARITLSNAISGTGALNCTGTGEFGLTGTSTYSGGTTLTSGSVIVGANSTGTAGSPTNGTFGSGVTPLVLAGSQLRATTTAATTVGNTVTLSANTTFYTTATEKSLIFTGPVTMTGGTRTLTSAVGTTVASATVAFNGAIGDGGNGFGIIKAGAGNLTLGGANTYTGPTTVNTGTLFLTGSIVSNSALTVAGGATFSMVNGTGTPLNTLAFLSLGVGAGTTTLNFDLGTVSDSLGTANPATIANAITFNFTAVSGFGSSLTYDLLTAIGGLDTATYSISSAPGGYSYALNVSPTLVQLVLTPLSTANTLYWNGNLNTSWSTFSAGTTNWFTDLAGTLNSSAAPGALTTVTFGTTTATGTAFPTLLNNNYTVNDLRFTSNPVGVASVSIGSGLPLGSALTIAPASPSAGISVSADAGAVAIAAPVVLGSSQTWSVDGGGATNTLNVSGGVSGVGGSTLSINGTNGGVVTLSGTNIYSGPTVVSNGGILFGGTTNSFSLNSAMTVSGNGILRLGGISNTVSSLSGDGTVQNNDPATAATLTINTTGNSDFMGALANGDVATLALTKTGIGSQTLSGVSTNTGNLTLSSGTLNVTGSLTGNGTISAGNQIILGASAANSILNVSGNITNYHSFTGANIAGSNVVYNQTGGLVNFTTTAVANVTNYLAITGYAYMNITGGTLVARGRFAPSNGTLGTGVIYVGGTGTLDHSGGEWFLMCYAATAVNGGLSEVTVGPGGSLLHAGAANNFGLNMERSSGYAVLNLAGGLLTTSTKSITFGNATGVGSNTTGILNLAAGTLTLGLPILSGNTGAGSTGNNAYLNFAGGTLQGNASVTAVIPATAATQTFTSTIYGPISNNNANSINNTSQDFIGGLTIDTNGFAMSFTNPFLPPSNSGVASANFGITGGSGYIGAPMVQFTGGTLAANGAPAAGYALIGGGAVTGIVVTSPGSYTAPPAITLTGGGGTGASVSVGALVSNTSGGLTKIGVGTLTLSGSNTYTGGTTINAGTLALGANDVLVDSGVVNINNGSTFDVVTFNDTVGVLTLNNGVIAGTTGILTASAYALKNGSASAILAGSVGITKDTAGTVTLSGANTFTGIVNITGGTLAFTASNNLGNGTVSNTLNIDGGKLSYVGATSVDLTPFRTLNIGSTGASLDASNPIGTMTISGAVAGTGNLTKTGPGTVVLSGSVSLNSGAGTATVSAGTLQAGFGTNGVNAINVASGANMNFSNNAAQILTLGAAPGALTLNDGAHLGFELGATGVNDKINVGTSAAVSGTISLDFYALAGFGAGSFDLITAGSGLSAASYVLGSAPNGFNYSITATDTLVSVTVTPYTPRYWKGGQDFSWTTVNPGPLTNWSTLADGSDEAGAVPSSAHTAIFSATNALFSSGSQIATTIGGALTLDSIQAIAAPAGITSLLIAPGGGSLTLAPLSTSGGIFIDANAGNVNLSAPLTVAQPQTWKVDGTGANGSSLTIDGNVSFNAAVSKSGAGVLTLNGANSGGSPFRLNGGTLNLGSATATGAGTLTFGAGTTIDNTSAGALTLTNNNPQVWGNFTFTGTNDLNLGSGSVTSSGVVTLTALAGTLTVGGGITGPGLTKAGSGTLLLNASNSLSGPLTITGGTVTLGSSNTISGGVTLSSGSLNIKNAAALGSNTFTIGSATSIDNLSGAALTLSTNNAQTWNSGFTFTGTNDLNLGTGAVTLAATTAITTVAGTLTVGGPITGGSFGLAKSGTGTLNLNANSTFSGATTVNNGTLNINGKLIGSGAVSGNILFYGSAAGTSIVNVNNDVTQFATAGGNVSGAFAIYNQPSGTVTVTPNTGNAQYVVKAAGAYGYFNLTGGTYKVSGANNRWDTNGANNLATFATGVVYVGGTGFIDHTNAEWFINGYSMGQITVAGSGAIDHTGSNQPFALIMNTTTVGGAYGVLNIAGGTVTTGAQPIRFGNSTTAGNGNGNSAFINLAGGTLSVGAAMNSSLPSAGGNNVYFNSAGGTLKATGSFSWLPATSTTIAYNSTIFGPIDNSALATAPSFGGGLTIDTNGFALTLSNNILGATGAGVTQADLAVTGGTGYVGAPAVQFSTTGVVANGTPAAGYALINNGSVTGIVITAPGTYTAGTIPTVTLIGGGGTGASITCGALNTTNSGAGLIRNGTGTLILSGADTYTGPTINNAGTLQIGAAGTIGSIANTSSILNNGILTYNRSDALTQTAAITGTGSLVQGGTATSSVILTGVNVLDGGTTITAGTLQIGNGGTTGAIGAGPITNNGTLIFNRSNTYNLTATNLITGTGALTMASGTVVSAVDNQIDLTGALTFGAATGSTTPATLNLTTSSANFSSLLVQTNSATANSIILGTGKTMTLTGGMTLGFDASSGTVGTQSKLTFSGGGALSVTGGNVIVGVSQATVNASNNSVGTLDVTGLSSFSANVTNFYAGQGSTSGGIVKLSNTANAITATTIKVGDSGGDNAAGANSLTLGTGTNVIKANTIQAGLSKASGTISFASTASGSPGTVSIANKAGTGAAAITIGQSTAGTGVTITGTLDLRGHTATINAGTVIVGSTGIASTGVANGTISFDSGTFNITTLNLGVRTNATVTGANTNTATLNIGGGTCTVSGVTTLASNAALGAFATNITSNINLTAGTLNLATITGPNKNSATNTGAATGNINVSGGALNITGATYVMATQSNAGTAVGLLSITGGSVTSNANITDGGGATTTTVTLNGGSLDMTGHSLGNATTLLDAINFQAGTLQNVLQINNGAGLTKTTTGTLVVGGTNSFTGAVTVSAGTLQLASPSGLGASGNALTVSAGATLDLNGNSNLSVAGIHDGGTTGSVSTAIITSATPATLTFSNATTGKNFGGTISGAISIVENAGTSFEVFAGSNTYTGTTTINGSLEIWNVTGLGDIIAGTTLNSASLTLKGLTNNMAFAAEPLTVNGASTLSLNTDSTLKTASFAAPITLSGGAVLNVVRGGNAANVGALTLSGVIDGAGALVIGGTTFTTTLTGVNTYNSTTTVSSGSTLALNTGSLAGTDVTVTDGATLQVGGNYSMGTPGTGSLTVAGGTTGGTLTTVDGTVNTLNLINNSGATTFTFGSDIGGQICTLNMEVGANSDQIILPANALVSIGTGSTNIINITGLGNLDGQTKTLISAPGGLSHGSFSSFVLGSIIAGNTNGYFLSLNATATELQLVKTVNPAPTPVYAYWKGALSSDLYAINSSAVTNWRTDNIGATDTNNFPGPVSNVFFTIDTAPNGPASNLVTTLSTNMTINSLNFTGTGTTAGASAMTIGGTKPLTLTAANSYTDTALNTYPAGTGLVTQPNSAAHTVSLPIVLNANQTWQVDSNITVSGGISGTANLTKTGAATLTLSGTNTYVGATNINTGIVLAGTANAFNAASNHNIAATGTLGINGLGETIGSLTGSGTVANLHASTAATLAVGADNTSTTFSGTIQNGGVGTLGFNKVGTGTLTLTGASSHTGVTTVNNGTLVTLGTSTATGNIVVGNQTFNAVLNVPTGGAFSGGTITAGNATGSFGAVNVTGGALTLITPDASTDTIAFGGANGGYGAFTISSGSFTQGRFMVGGVSGSTTTGGVGTALISGGTVNSNGWIIISRHGASTGAVTITGGLLNHAGASNSLAVGLNGSGRAELNVAGGLIDNTGSKVTFAAGTGGTFHWTGTGVVNLNAGTLLTNNIGYDTVTPTGNSYLNFNGGTLKAATTNATFLPAFTPNATYFNAVTLNAGFGTFAGGLTMDTNGFDATISANLLAPTGNGVRGLSLDAQGSGYIGAPHVQILDGGLPSTATAYAVVGTDASVPATFGKVTSVVITNPGVIAGVPTVNLIGGGGTGAAVSVSSTGANASGGLTKTGLGTLTLTGSASTFTAGVTINQGVLAVGLSATIPLANTVNVNGGTLDMQTFNNTVNNVILQNAGSIAGTTGLLTSLTAFDFRDGTASGILDGTVGVNKTTAGTVTLSGVNTFSGSVIVSGGTLQFTSGPNLGNNSVTNTVTVNGAGATLSYTGSGSQTLGNNQVVAIETGNGTLDVSNSLGVLNITTPVVINGTLTKTGPGMVVLSNNISNGGTGNVTVSAGTLQAGFGGGIHALNVGTSGNMSFLNNTMQTLNLDAVAGSLTLASGAQLGFELGASGVSDSIVVGSSGTATASVAGTVRINFFNAGIPALGGSYTLITSPDGGLLPVGVDYVLGSAPNGYNYTFNKTDTLVSVTITPFTPIYWNGAVDSNWTTLSILSNYNWTTDPAGTAGALSVPTANDTVIFSTSFPAPFTSGTSIVTTLVSPFTVDSIQTSSNPTGITAVTINSPGTLTLSPLSASGGIFVPSNSGTLTIAAPLTVSKVQTWSVDGTGANGSALVISSNTVFNAGVVKTGAGALTLSGANSGTGNISLTSGTLNVDNATALGTGTLNISPGTTIDSPNAPIVLTSANPMNWNGSFTFTGTQNLSTGTGPITLGNNLTLTTVANTLTVDGVISGTNRTLTKTGAGTLVLNGSNTYSGLTSVSAGVLTLNGANTGAGGMTLAAGTLNIGNASALGTGAFTISSGTVDNTSGNALTLSTNNAQNWNGSFTFTGTSSLNLGTGTVTLGATPIVTVAANTLTVGGAITSGTLLGLTKNGPGTLAVNGTSTYTGGTTLDGGTLTFGTNQTLPGALTFGLALGSTNLSTLDLTTFNASFAGATLIRTNNLLANTIMVDAGKTLTLTGGLTLGYDAGAGTGATVSNLTVGGTGSLSITGATINISTNQAATNAAYWNEATLNVTSLASFNTNVTTFNIGVGTTTTGPGNLLLSNTANTIIATTLNIGDTGSNNGRGLSTVTLGTGTNVIQADTIHIGRGKSNGNATVQFASQTPGSPGTLTITNKAGTGSAVINVANINGVGTAGGAVGILDLRGHTATINSSTLLIANNNGSSTGGVTGTVYFDGGTFSATTLNLGPVSATASTGGSTATLNVSGGAFTAGTVNFAAKTAAGTGIASGALNLSGGTFTVNTACTMGSEATAGSSTATLTLTGGTFTSNVNILTGAGTVTSKITLNGGTLDLKSHALGSATVPITTLEFQSGTLMNVTNINNGALLDKTTTGILTLSGTNTFSGGLQVTQGTVQLGSATGLASSNVLTMAGVSSTTSTFAMNGFDQTVAGLAVAGASTRRIINGSPTTTTFTVNNPSTAYTYSSQLGASGGTADDNNLNFVKAGAGTFTLSGNNSYTGTTTVSAGILTVGANTSLGSTAGGTTVASGATLEVGASIDIGAEPLTLSGTGTTGLNGAIHIGSSRTLTQSGPITLSGNTLIKGDGGTTFTFAGNINLGGFGLNITTDGATVNSFTGVISGTGSLTKNSTAAILLGGANTYGGDTLINAGTLRLGAPEVIPNGVGKGNVVVAGTLDLNTFSESINGMTGAGTVDTIAGGTPTFTVGDNDQTSTFTGIIKNTTGALGLTKVGTGTLTTSGANTYSGSTLVSAGTLRGAGSINSAFTVNSKLFAGTAPAVADSANYTPFTGNQDLAVASVSFSPSSSLQAVVNVSAGVAYSTRVIATGTASVTAGALLDLGIGNGVYPSGDIILLDSGTANISTTFKIVHAVPVGMQLVYSDGVSSEFIDPGTLPSSATTIGFNAKKVLLRVSATATVTPVKIADFKAETKGLGVNVSWKAVSEYQNAGFNIYRRSSEGGEWTLVNPALIAGRVTNPDEKNYSFFDWVSAGEWQYKLESVDLSGLAETYEQFAEPVNVDWNADVSVANDVDFGSVSAVNDGFAVMAGVRNAQIVSATVAALKQGAVAMNKVAVRELKGVATVSSIAVRSLASAPVSASVSNVGVRWFSNGKVSGSSFTAAKLIYSKPGVMIIPQNAMPNGYDLNNVSLQREGRNFSALAKVPAGLLVYAPGYADDYTDKDALFIRKSGAATNVVSAPTSTGLFNSSAPVNVSSPATVSTDYHDVYFDFSTALRPFTFTPWFSNKYLTQGTTQDFVINLPQASSGPAKLTLSLWSLTSSTTTDPDHALQLVVNGQIVGDVSWDGGNKMIQLSFDVPTGVIRAGENTVSVVTPTLNGVSNQVTFMHSISADYTRTLDGSKSFEIVNNTGKSQLYELNNVPATGAWVVDTRFSDRASLVSTETQVQADGSLRVRFMASAGGSGKFVVTPTGQENTPISINARMVRTAKLTGTYLATGPLSFASGTQTLLTKRSKEGIRGTYFDQEQLFDYYNFGRFGPDGIRNAVRSLKPTYLLLVGRTTYDYRNYQGKNIDPLCPAYLISTSFWAQTTSDSLFGDLGRGYPEVAVGRLPVNNTTELSGAIGHILGYKGIPQSGLRLHAVADQPDPLTIDFGAQLDEMVKAYNPDVTWQENYLQRTYQTSPEVTEALKTAANGGADLILYSGHGNAARLGNTSTILDQTTVQQWKGNTVFLQATCTANWMAKNVDDYKSIAIQALTQSQGGISASVGTSTYMNPDVATAFMNQLIKNTNKSNARWGSVLLSTQQWAGKQTNSAFYTDLMNTEQLFGDPAMPVFAPKTINTVPSNNSGAGTPVGTF